MVNNKLDKKEALMQVLNIVSNINLSNVMLIRTNGSLLANNFPENSVEYVKKIAIKYKDIPVNNYVKANVSDSLNLILFKISVNIFLVCLSGENEKDLIKIFKGISEKYSFILYELFKDPVLEKKIRKTKFIKYVVFSKTSDLGPTPVACFPNSIDEQEKFEISAKSILVLSAGFNSQTNSMNHMTSIIPFANMDCIGLVYTFAIPSPQARGKSFDSAITVLVYSSYKKLLLNHLEQIELAIKEITQQIINNKEPNSLLEALLENIELIMQEKENKPHTQEIANSLKDAMVSEIRKIQEKRPYSTLLY